MSHSTITLEGRVGAGVSFARVRVRVEASVVFFSIQVARTQAGCWRPTEATKFRQKAIPSGVSIVRTSRMKIVPPPTITFHVSSSVPPLEEVESDDSKNGEHGAGCFRP